MPVVDGVAYRCDDSAVSGVSWVDDVLDSKGAFTGAQSTSVCDPSDGFSWGILGSFQDKSIDPTTNPTVTSWGSTTIGSTTYRYFDITVPANWDWRSGP
jgi:hypothetical protein